MILELKYPGIFLASAIVLVFFAVRFYLNRESIRTETRSVLFALKFFFLSLFAIYIFQPVIVRTQTRSEPAKHLILFDNSRSVTLNDISDSIRFGQLAEYVRDNENFETYFFGNELRKAESKEKPDFSDDFTNISIPEINSLVLKAAPDGEFRSVTLVTDGNFSDAANYSLKPDVPVNIIYGSVRTDAPDIFIKEIYYEDTAPENSPSKFSVLTGYSGKESEGTYTLAVTENGIPVKKTVNTLPGTGAFVTSEIELPEPSSDFRELEFIITPLPGEKNLYNNKAKAFQRKGGRSGDILIAANTPSFDLAFLEKTYKNAGYSFTTLFEKDLSDTIDITKYRTLVTLDIPSGKSAEKTAGLLKKFSSGLHFAGQGTSLSILDRTFGLKLSNYRYIQASGILNKDPSGSGEYLFMRNNRPFSLSELPSVLYNSAFLPDETRFRPVVHFSETESSKAVYQYKSSSTNIIIVNFSSFWRALFNDENGDFASFILNLTDQASLDISQERILIEPDRTGFTAGERILFSGKILDENLRPAASVKALLKINELGLEVPFKANSSGYTAETVINEPGIYTAEVSSFSGKTVISKKIDLRITENDLETRVLGADLNVIKSFTAARKGLAIPVSEAEDFIDERTGITENKTIETRTDITRNFYFFIILILLFLTELTVRKYKDLS